jgi:tritrans,polycis-undecaprenyl-diphosphate synthase [geranylgeranyl-diphosphate specific]
MKVPNHLGVILDGNRRWARKRGLPVWYGHREGARKLEKLLQWCLDLGIRQVSIYSLSTENIANRSKRELDEIFKIFYEYIDKLLNDKFSLLEKYNVRVRFVGELNRLPKSLVRLMGKLMEKTAKHQKRLLNFLIAYGGKSELVYVFRRLAERAIRVGKVEITERDIEKNLWISDPVDLIIRTGGYSRLSNFLIWQASYGELFITKKLWPDFEKRDLIRAIKWFNSVKRNFGK